MMSIKNPLVIALSSSILALGGTATYSHFAIDQALDSKLPLAVEAVLKAQADKEIESARNKIVAGWNLAADGTVDGRHFYGNLKAEFTLVEFSDLECGFCKRFHETPKQLVGQSNGRINWEWQHYPLQFHDPAAKEAAHASECVGELAGNQAFWAFTGEWFSRSAMNGQGYDNIEHLAREVGAPLDEYRACMESGKYKEKIEQQIAKGTAAGVTGTPATVVVDNTTGRSLLVKGAQPASSLLEAMKQLMSMRNSTPNQEKPNDE